MNRVISSADLSALPTTSRPVRVVLADDECMFRASLRHLLTAPASVVKEVYGIDLGTEFEVVGEAGSGEDTVTVVQAMRPDLLMIDLAMPRLSGIEAVRQLHRAGQVIPTVLLAGAIDNSSLLSAVQIGIRGFVKKSAPTEVLFEAVRCVLAGQCWADRTIVGDLMEVVRTLARPAGTNAPSTGHGVALTPRERDILSLVMAGYPNKEIARTFTVSEETIKHHLTRMFDKVGAANRLELAMIATQRGLATSL
jgi:two-component system nitrate/nitrite response regulator NarL